MPKALRRPRRACVADGMTPSQITLLLPLEEIESRLKLHDRFPLSLRFLRESLESFLRAALQLLCCVFHPSTGDLIRQLSGPATDEDKHEQQPEGKQGERALNPEQHR